MVCFLRAVIINAPLEASETPALGVVKEKVPFRVAVSDSEHFLFALHK